MTLWSSLGENLMTYSRKINKMKYLLKFPIFVGCYSCYVNIMLNLLIDLLPAAFLSGALGFDSASHLVVTLQPPRAGLALRQPVFAFWFLSHFYVRGTVDFLAFRNESRFASSMIGSFLSFSWGLAFPLTLLGVVLGKPCSLRCCPFSWASKWRHRKQTRLQPHPESGPPCWSQSLE